jgi:serine/threonine-protein kinase HipA
VSRFDRRTDSNGTIHRIHQEDACQALGIDPERNRRLAKYEEFGGPTLLAPLYDTVPTALWPKLRATAAMKVNGKADLSRITIEDIVAEARLWNLEPRSARDRAKAIAERLLDVLRTGAVDVDSPALGLITDRLGTLLHD